MTGLGRRTREEMWDQTDSPEIPDRGETSEISRPPFGDKKRREKEKKNNKKKKKQGTDVLMPSQPPSFTSGQNKMRCHHK